MSYSLGGCRRVVPGGIAFLATLMSVTACDRQQKMSPAESGQAVQTLTTWFECEECQSGELEAVQKYGQAVVPSLIAVLDGGLSPAKREQTRSELEARHDALTERARKNPNAKPTSTKEQFTAQYLGNFDAQYRVRAAQALAAIGGDKARAALQAAARKPHRGDVQAVIETSLRTVR